MPLRRKAPRRHLEHNTAEKCPGTARHKKVVANDMQSATTWWRWGESKPPCGAARVAALTCPRHVIHYRSRVRFSPILYDKQKHRLQAVLLFVVEMGRIELPSESASSGTSPGADGYLHSLVRAQAVMLADLVASLCVVRSKLCALTFTTSRRLVPDRGPSGGDAHRSSGEKNSVVVVL